MRSIQLTILFLSLIGNTIAQAQSLDPERTLYIEGAISGQTLDPLMDKLIDLTRKVFTDKNSGSSMPGFDMGGQMDPIKHTYYLIWSRYQYMLNPMQGGN